MQRTLIIIVSVVVLLGLGVGSYFLFFAKPATIIVAPTTVANLPSAGQEIPATATPADTGTLTLPAPMVAGTGGRLIQISVGPVVPGEAVIDIKPKDASSSPETAVNYIERQSGNVFSYSTKAHTITRINNKTIPGIQSASWVPDGSTAFIRYLSGTDFSTINTYALSAASSTGFFLPQNLLEVAVSSTSVLTLASGINSSVISLARTDGSQPKTLFTTPLTSLHVSFMGKDQYLAYSKPSASLDGYAFLVDKNGIFSRISGPLKGLVALASPSGKSVLVSYIQGASLQMQLIDTTTNVATALPVATIADKCVWTPDDTAIYCGIPQSPDVASTYPDDWYQGAAHFSDRIWKIQVDGRYAQFVLDFSSANKGDLDATALALDPLNTTLVFVNKNDGSLWSYSL